MSCVVSLIDDEAVEDALILSRKRLHASFSLSRMNFVPVNG